MRSKQFGIILLLALIAPLICTFIGLQIEKAIVKSHVENNVIRSLNKKDVRLLKFTQEEVNSELEWEHEKEFEYLGEMYDVVATETINDTAYFWCYHDHKETKLNEQLSDLFSGKLSHPIHKRRRQEKSNKLLKTLFHSSSSHQLFYSEKRIISSIYSSNNIESISIRPPSPPPQPC